MARAPALGRGRRLPHGERRVKFYWPLIIAIAAYLGAEITNDLLWQKIEAALPLSSKKDPDARHLSFGAGASVAEDYTPILESHFFNPKAREEGPDPQGAPAPEPVIGKAPLNFVVVGTIVGPPSYAVIEDGRTKEQALYRVGDPIADGAWLARINRNTVVVRRGDAQETLEVAYFPKEKAPLAAAVSAPAEQTDILYVAKGHYVLDRREVDNAVENLPQILTKARIIPNFSNGKPDGFRIFSIVPDSLYAKIGLKNGDILHRVNDIEVKDPQNVMKIFEQMKDESHIRVDLVRNNQKETLSYEIR